MNEPLPKSHPRFMARLMRPLLIGLLIVIALMAILVVIVFPMIPWASSGSIRFPVRVFVFDATLRTPISEADVAVFNSPPVLGANSLSSEGRIYRADRFELSTDSVRSVTGTDGMAVLDFEFRTSANNTRPAPEVHTRWAWVEVHADGYGTVVIPVRHDSMKADDLQKFGELLVPVGLAKSD